MGGLLFEFYRILIIGYFFDMRFWLIIFWLLFMVVFILFFVFFVFFIWNFVVVFFIDLILFSSMKVIYFGLVLFFVKFVILFLLIFNIINFVWWLFWIVRNGWRFFWDRLFNFFYINYVFFLCFVWRCVLLLFWKLFWILLFKYSYFWMIWYWFISILEWNIVCKICC